MTMRRLFATAMLHFGTMTVLCQAETIVLRRDVQAFLEADSSQMQGAGEESLGCAYEGGRILLSHPMSIDRKDRHYFLAGQ